MRDWLVHLPASLTEADLVAMVDGDVSEDREQIAIAALKAEPRLGLLVKHMRADRAAVSALAIAKPAPAELAEKILTVVDRRMIRELDQLAQQSGDLVIPVSTLTIHQPTIFELFVRGPWMKRLPIAAGILLALGLVGYVARVSLDRPNAAPGTLAVAPPKVETQPLGKRFESITRGPSSDPAPSNTDNAPKPAVKDEPVVVVDATPTGAPSTATDSTSATSSVAAPSTEEGPSVSLADIERPSPPVVPAASEPIADPTAVVGNISTAAAAELAAEGRLVIIITGRDAQSRLTTLARSTTGPTSTFVIEPAALDRLPPAVLAFVPASSPRSSPTQPDPGPTRIAGDGPAAMRTPILDRPEPADLGSPSGASALAHTIGLEPTEANLMALKTALEQNAADAGAVIVRFGALPTPLPQSFNLTPESILWWNSPPARWSRTATIPVIVDPAAP